MDFWGAVIQAGVSLAGGLLEGEREEQKQAYSKEEQLLELQDNERDRIAQTEQNAARITGTIEAANIGAEAQMDSTKKRVLGDALLNIGQGQERALLESYRAQANRPERFNQSANILAQILSR